MTRFGSTYYSPLLLCVVMTACTGELDHQVHDAPHGPSTHLPDSATDLGLEDTRLKDATALDPDQGDQSAPSDGDGGDSEMGQELDPECFSLPKEFTRRLYAEVLQPQCQSCHNPAGIAASHDHVDFVLRALQESADSEVENFEATQRAAARLEQGRSVLLAKPLGELDHLGGVVLKEDSEEYALLVASVERLSTLPRCQDDQLPSPLDGVEHDEPARLLRRLTFTLAERFPTDQEMAQVERGELDFEEVVDGLMQEGRFLDVIERRLNDIFHVQGADINASLLDDSDFPNNTWHQQWPSGSAERDRAIRHISDGLRRQPYELVRHILAHDLPFSEILTADYTLVNYATARTYGVEDQVDFKGEEDPDAFQIARLGAPTRADTLQRYPHAGFLTMHPYLIYYTTTDTNRNRARARVFYEQFFDVDLLELAPQGGGDSQAVAALENPVRDAEQCNVCHFVVDPVAGAFQHIDFQGRWRPRRDGWYTDTFPTGLESEVIPEADLERPLQWLGERAVQDPRFARAMVAHAYYIVIGRRPMGEPTDASLPGYLERRRAYAVQQAWLRGIEEEFIESGFDFKLALKSVALSPYFSARSIKPEVLSSPDYNEALYHDLGATRLLTPEALGRKIELLFGSPWRVYNRQEQVLSNDQFGFYQLYGGIDSVSLFDRPDRLNTPMLSVAATMANEVPCRYGMPDFKLPKSERLLFPWVDRDDTLQTDRAAIKANVQHLFWHLLGEKHELTSDEVQDVADLFDTIQQEGVDGIEARDQEREAREQLDPNDPRHDQPLPGYDLNFNSRCGELGDDPDYTYRAWLAVLTWMLSDWAFLHH